MIYRKLTRSSRQSSVRPPGTWSASALLYLAKNYDGLGIRRFSDEVQLDKLGKIYTALRSHSLHQQATQGLLNRALRKSGQYIIPGTRSVVDPTAANTSHKQRLFSDSIIQWLAQMGLRLCRQGNTVPAGSLLQRIRDIPNVPDDLLKHCDRHDMRILGDLVTTDPRTNNLTWYAGGPYHQLLSHIPSTVPDEPIPLIAGQYWKMRHHATNDIRSGNIVRIDGNTAEGVAVTRWTVPDPTKPSQAQATNKPYVVPYEQLFPELMATRVTVILIIIS